MSAPLAKHQKAYLARLAARAYYRSAAIARGRGEVLADDYSSSRHTAEWRRKEVAAACGKNGLRCCSQNDYKLVEAHFLNLLGEPGKAMNSFVQASTEKRRVAEFKVIEACKEFGFHLSYADKVCRAQNHGAGLQEVGEQKLWQIFYTIRNRGRKRESTKTKNNE